MQPYTQRALSRRRAEVEPVLPPDLRTLGALPFTQQELEALRGWLDEGGWPRASMNIDMLEGYLVALLVWPVELPSGAWLPLIWGERGWKVPAKLAAPGALGKFTALVSGFLQELDRRLSGGPPGFSAATGAPEPKRRGQRPEGCPWAMGFLNALQQHSQGLKYRSAAAKAAATNIARWASRPATTETRAELARAVSAIAAERSSRGPLGSLGPVARAADPV